MGHTMRMHGSLLWIELTGTLTLDGAAQLVDEADRVAAELGRDPDRLVDISRLGSSELVFETFLTLRQRRDRRPPMNPHRVAIVASSLARFGGARMYQQVSEEQGRQIEIFDSVERALLWLGVDLDLGEVK